MFGPLTTKQFIFLTGGLGCAYLAYQWLPSTYGISIAVLVAYVTFRLMRQAQPPTIDEAYIKTKRLQVGSVEEYCTWLNQHIAVTKAEIAERQRKGFVRDPSLDVRLQMFETALRDAK